MARATMRQMTFADLELALQGVQLDPTLQAICDLFDQHREVLERVQCDLNRGLKHPGHGRHGLTARQVLGALGLMRIKNWDYRELRERIADGVSLRQYPRCSTTNRCSATVRNSTAPIAASSVNRTWRRA